ncbi:MAG: dTMP kinase [Candidatus Helarchaeota archaeon]
MKPVFIVLDGIDGCGSTTHTKLLEKWFKDLKLEVYITHEPTNSNIGKIIKENLKLDKSFPELDALLFAADRIKHSKEISNLLKNKINVISDRYFESSIAYQGAQGLDLNWIKTLNKNILEADIYIILDVDPKISLERITKERRFLEKFEKLETLRKVRSIFLKRANEMGYDIIDSSASIELVHEKITNIIRKRIPPRY